MKYSVVFEKELDVFIKKVNEMIEDGWKPVGNLVVSSRKPVYSNYYQAMIKKDFDDHLSDTLDRM